MCGRFYVDDGTGKAVQKIIRAMRSGRLGEGTSTGDDAFRVLPDSGMTGSSRDIHPSEKAEIIAFMQGDLSTAVMRWGFPSYRSGQLMINARCETALEKPSFSESLMARRCVIPAAGFYEWDSGKNKVTFFSPQAPYMFLAGFYNLFDGEDRFIILTREANEDMAPVHDRMPLILPEEEIADWIMEPGKTKEFLRRDAMRLSRKQDYEQMTLPGL